VASSPVVCSRASNRRGRRALASTALLVLGVAAASASASTNPAAAHPADPGIHTVLDAVEPELPGVTIAVAVSASPQLVVSNPTPVELVVVAETGEPFLRIGPEGVLANFDSPAWYLSNSPGGAVTVPESARPDAPPRWALVATEPAWGWFDHRLHPQPGRVPPDVLERGERSTLARWEVPFDYGGQPVTARGRIQYRPDRGRVSAHLVGPSDPFPSVSVQLSAGPVPGLVLRNTGADPVTVYGPTGEPFARVGPAGAEVNRRSPAWVDNARAQERDPAATAAVVDAAAPPEWLVVSSAPTFAWLEFRGAYPDDEPPPRARRSTEPTVLREWSVPVEAGGQRVTVSGQTIWSPTTAPGAATEPGWWESAPVVVVAVFVFVVLGGAGVALLRRRTAESGAGATP
jgi:hypothetical protein